MKLHLTHIQKNKYSVHRHIKAKNTASAKKEGDGRRIINFITLLGLPYIIVNIIIKYITGFYLPVHIKQELKRRIILYLHFHKTSTHCEQ